MISAGASGCRGERANSNRFRQWLPGCAFVLFVVGYWSANFYIRNVPVADRFEGFGVQFGLWWSLIGAIGGFALAGGLYFVVWLVDLIRLSTSTTATTVLSWLIPVVVVGATVLVSLFVGLGDEPRVAQELSEQTRWITALAGLCLAPGLVAFVVLRSVARSDAGWGEDGRCQLVLVLRLRAELRRLLSTFGAFLTLLVVATGMRRRALLAYDRTLVIPSEQVLLYGLVFAAILGLFYVSASSAINDRAQQLIDQFAPLPDPSEPDLSERLDRRDGLAVLMSSGGTWHMFETTVVIAAPLLTGIIGSATGG